MKPFFFSLCLIGFLSFGLIIVPQTTSNSKDAHLSIMTFNIRRKGKEKNQNRLWDNRIQLVLQIIQQYKPDVVGLQEATPEQITDLQNALHNYRWFGKERGKSWFGLGKSESNPIFYNTSKLKLIDQDTFKLYKSSLFKLKKTGWLPRICTWGLFALLGTEKLFYVYNTHLDNKFPTARINGISAILQKITEQPITNLPIFIQGDFNTNYEGNFRSALENMNNLIVNTKDISQLVTGPQTTFTDWGDSPEITIDHILITNDNQITVHKHETISEQGSYPSDHRPVMINVSV